MISQDLLHNTISYAKFVAMLLISNAIQNSMKA